MTIALAESLGSDVFRWGIDLFNHGYYWEAHEAWEPLWHAAKRSTQHRLFFKGLILLAAAGVKIREGKQVAAVCHATRAAALFRQVVTVPSRLRELDEASSGSLLKKPVMLCPCRTPLNASATTGS
ncbi:DUF309 domain-containing protein [Mesorhizobium sp. M1396]|uniref:DUF309 domain-containing protein n=1 Tax=Mesorhizobium sp. M1396 TaxID=2957095 RepID=UPI00333795A5